MVGSENGEKGMSPQQIIFPCGEIKLEGLLYGIESVSRLRRSLFVILIHCTAVRCTTTLLVP
jgi:hypothetical protein